MEGLKTDKNVPDKTLQSVLSGIYIFIGMSQDSRDVIAWRKVYRKIINIKKLQNNLQFGKS